MLFLLKRHDLKKTNKTKQITNKTKQKPSKRETGNAKHNMHFFEINLKTVLKDLGNFGKMESPRSIYYSIQPGRPRHRFPQLSCNHHDPTESFSSVELPFAT